MSELKYLTLLQNAARAWNNEDEPGLDAAMEEIEIFLIDRRTQPEATKPAQDLGAAIARKLSDTVKPILTPEDFGILDPELAKRAINFANAMMHQAALASPADALVAGDRVDAEVREALEELYYTLPDILPAAGYKRLQETGQWSSKATWDLRGHTGKVKYRADDMQSVYAAMDRVRAAIQAQKDGHK